MNQTQTQASLFSDFRVLLVNKDNLRAVASCKVGEAICLSGIRVVEGAKGRFVAMPSKKDAKGEYQDIFFPANREIREQLQVAVLSKYNEVLKSQASVPASF
jgi:stage V sporulation protein G